ncbi:hypothetical protein JW851_00680 [Candidatus Woesearchaeota archaeon]|nr:hypothetical protein [Candidatus Woesearchaeota archaeon]
MIFEEELIEFMKKASPGQEHEYSMDIKYLALDLITGKFNCNTLAKKAKKSDVNHRLGFLCEITARAAKTKGFKNYKRIYNLVNKLYTKPARPQYLDPTLADFGKRILDSSQENELNKKWQVRSSLNEQDIIKWIELHMDYVTASQRNKTY